MFCTNCGSELPDDARFCEACGTRVEFDADPTGESESEEAHEPQTPAKQPQASTIAAPQSAPAQAIASQDRQSKRSPGVIAGVAAGACAALAAIVVVVTMFMGSGSFKPVKIDSATFPDEKLRNVVFTFDTDGDGVINESEMAAIQMLQLDGVDDYSGLQHFANLESLVITNPVTSNIQLPDNTTIETIEIKPGGSRVEAVNFGNNSSLKNIDMTGSGANQVNASGCTSLQTFEDTDDSLEIVELPPSSELKKIVVNEDVALPGLEGTGVKEHWIPVSYEAGGRTSSGRAATPERLELELDESGHIVKALYETSYWYDCQYSYDDNGQVVSMRQKSPGSEFDVKVTYDQGRVATVSSSDPNNSYTTTYSYGNGSAPLSAHRESSHAYAGRYAYDVEYSYDASGLLASRVMRQEDFEPAELFIDYDNKGLVSNVLVSNKMEEDYGYEVTRDAEGRITQVDSTHPNGPFLINKIYYASDGRLNNATSEPGPTSGSPTYISSSSFTYDEHGLLTSWTMQGGGDEGITRTYKVEYARILATDEEYANHDALKAIDISNVFHPSCNIEFFNPEASFGDAYSNLAYSGCPSFFVNKEK